MSSPTSPNISVIVAMGSNRVIGKANTLLWHIPDDLRRFKKLTLGHPVILGRKTFESIVSLIGHALRDRMNIVITHDLQWKFDGVVTAHSFEEALQKAKSYDTEEIFIAGGAQIYAEALPYVDRLYITMIDDEKEGDVFFPPYENIFTKKIFEEEHEWEGLHYRWIDLER